MSSTPKQSEKTPLAQLVIVYGTMLLFGLIENVKGVSFPLIKSEFGVAYNSQGGLVSLTWLGYVLFCLVASLFMHRFGIKRSLLAGYLLICLGAIATLTAPSFWAASITLLIVNAGFGFFEVGANALGTVIFVRRAALMMNLMHFFYGFGAILGPKAAGLLTDTLDLTWRQVYLTVVVPTLLFAGFVLFTRFRRAEQQETQAERISFVSTLKLPIVWLFCLTLGFMEVIEFGAANWGGLYLFDVYGLDPRTVGASFVASFYTLFTLSRLLSGVVIERVGYLRSLYVAVVGTAILLALGFALGARGIWPLAATGLGIGIMWPTMMAVAMRYFGDQAPLYTSVIITVSGAVNGVFQMVVGLTNHLVGEAWGYRSSLLYAGVVLTLLWLLARRIQAGEASRAAQVAPGLADSLQETSPS